jgi:zinc transport system permease protein
MTGLAEVLSFEFMRNAVLTGVLASILCGVIGTLVVVKRLVFISGGISHAAFGGLGMFYFLGLDPRVGAIAISILSALLLGTLDKERLRSQDAMIGVLWAVGMAIGIVFIYKTPGFAPNLMTYLFGNILMVSRSDVMVTLALDLAVLLILALFYKEFVAVAFDEEFARVQGVPVRPLLMLLLVLIALSVVMLIQVVGIVLVIALLTVPPLISLILLRDLLSVLLASVVTAVVMTLGGLGTSYWYDVPSGPAIVLLGAALMIVVYALHRLYRRPPTVPLG